MRRKLWRLVMGALLSAPLLIVVYQLIAWRVSFLSVQGKFPLKEKWSYYVGEQVVDVSASPDGVTIIRTSKSTLGLESATGILLWTAPIGSSEWPAPAQFGESEAFVADKERVWALDKRTGQILWNKPVRYLNSDARVVAVSRCCVLVDRVSTEITAYDRMNGVVRWMLPTGRGFVTAHVQDNVVYVADRGIQALDEATGNMLWTKGERVISGSDYQNGIVYYNESPFRIVALDTQRQIELWRTDLDDDGPSTLRKAGDYVLVDSYTNFYVLNARTGSLVWQSTVKGYEAVLLDDVIYIGDGIMQSVLAFQATTGQELGILRFGLPFLLIPQDSLTAQSGLLIIAHGGNVYAYSKP